MDARTRDPPPNPRAIVFYIEPALRGIYVIANVNAGRDGCTTGPWSEGVPPNLFPGSAGVPPALDSGTASRPREAAPVSQCMSRSWLCTLMDQRKLELDRPAPTADFDHLGP